MAVDIVIDLQVNDAIRQSTDDRSMTRVLGMQYGVYLATGGDWYPYNRTGLDEIKDALNFVYTRSGMNNSVTILITINNGFTTQEKFLRKAFAKKTAVKEAYTYAYPFGMILNPLENIIITDFKVTQHKTLSENKKLKIPGMFEVFSFEAKKITVL